MKPALRVYGEVRGLSPEAWDRLVADCPLDTATYSDGVLEFEHEGGWVDVEGFLEALAQALSPQGSGHADVIDNDAWTITRSTLAPGVVSSQTFGVDDVLENTKGEGNL